jgi:hypothetical protein
MKTIIKLVFIPIVLSFVSCSDDNTPIRESQYCLTEELGITEEHKNSYPQALGAYTDWKWTILNDSVLRIKTEYTVEGTGGNSEYYYFNIDKEKSCLTFRIAKIRFFDDVQVDNPEIGEVDYGDSSDYTFKLQYWAENEKFIGKIIPNFSDYPEADQKIFWVELTQDNHEPQTDWEQDLGL